MTLDQALAFGILGVTILLFLWGRLPYDLVALLSLLAGLVTGVVPIKDAFNGFSDDIVIIVGSALLVSAAIGRSGVVEAALRPVLPHLPRASVQVPVLAGIVMVLSAVTKNVGALAIMMPAAMQVARRTGTSPSCLLMPMAFASLVGGLVTLVGTSPNIIVSRVRGEMTGEPFGMFDFAPVGLCIAAASLAVLAIAYRLLPGGRKGQAGMEAAFSIAHYTTEAEIPEESELAGQKVSELIALAEGEVTITGVIRDRVRRHHPAPDLVLQAGDAVMLEGPAEDLEALVERAGLRLVGEREEVAAEDAQLVEGVVTGTSPLIGQAPAEADLHGRYGLNLLAVSRRGQRLGQKLARERLRAGDVVILKGEAERVPEALGELRVLPLSERKVALGRGRAGLIPPFVLGAAMLLVGFGIAPVGIAFFGAAVTLLALRTLTMREAYDAMEWPVLFLLAALIPVSESIRTTGGTDLIAAWLQDTVSLLPPLGALALIMAIAMAVTPFLNNAATVLVMAPIAASLAERLQLAPDAFLMAVAVGAACDFLTPIGHQCNTLVMGPGGYRFGDYWRLGLPLTLTVLAVGVPAIAFFWPLG